MEGRAHFTFARSYDVIELAGWRHPRTGRPELAVLYTLGEGGGPGHMALLVDGNEVAAVEVDGKSPAGRAARRGRAAHRTGHRVPGFGPLLAPAPFGGTVHQLRIDTPGTPQADPADEVRAALHAD